MDGAIFSGSEVVHAIFPSSNWEVERKTSCVNKSHASFLFPFYTLEDVFLVGVSLSFQLHELCILKTFLH